MRSITLIFLAVAGVFDFGHAAVLEVAGPDGHSIQAAIDAATSGDVVNLPPGRFAVRQSILLKSRVHLRGAGMDATTLVFEGTQPGSMVSMSGCEAAELSQLTLDGNSDANAQQGVYASNAKRLRIHHVGIKNLVKGTGFGPHGIHFNGISPSAEAGVVDSVISDCLIENIGVDADFGGGIRLSWGSSNNRLERNTIRGTGRGGIFADNRSTDNSIVGNTVSSSGGEGLGIEVWGDCDRSVIEDNRIDHWLSIGGCDYSAARRNVVSDKSGVFKFCGIEAIGSYLIVADNSVDDGAKIGLSVSGTCKNDYVYWARNTVRACNQWGTQLQGEADGINFHYVYKCVFKDMPAGVGPVWYPGDEGHGFRMLSKCRHVIFDQCEFSNNARAGIQLLGNELKDLAFVDCRFTRNRGPAVLSAPQLPSVSWIRCESSGNGADTFPTSQESVPPGVDLDFNTSASMRVNTRAGESFSLTLPSEASSESATYLWDFGEGPPVTEAAPWHTFSIPGEHPVTCIAWLPNHRPRRVEFMVQAEAAS